MAANRLSQLLNQVTTFRRGEEEKFSLLDPDDVKALSENAALIELRAAEYWLPFSQLREDDGQLYASNWILEQKGIEV